MPQTQPIHQQRETHERWLRDLTMIPTAAGREQRVIQWVTRWVSDRPNLRLRADKAGNLLITRLPTRPSKGKTRRTARTRDKSGGPLIFITAHLDHPAFVVREAGQDGFVELEFRGGVNDAFFELAPIDIFDSHDHPHRAVITKLDPSAKPFKRVTARLKDSFGNELRPGDVGRWAFEGRELPYVDRDRIFTHACDDLAAVAAALATLDVLRAHKKTEHVGVLLTRAEEIGFIGAIAACKLKSVPKSARLICLENSRSFAESPIGGGPIVRVGDKMSVFEPNLTNRISLLMQEHQKANPEFRFQRKLMPGGTCEATTFSTFGYQSTCICLPLGNYHNMTPPHIAPPHIDPSHINSAAHAAGPAKVGPEFISLSDYHGMIEMLVLCATQLDSAKTPSLEARMNELYKQHGHILREGEARPKARAARK